MKEVRTFRKEDLIPAGTPAGDRKRIAVTFPEWMFDAINLLATERHLSFAEQVRQLCSRGIGEQPLSRSQARRLATVMNKSK